ILTFGLFFGLFVLYVATNRDAVSHQDLLFFLAVASGLCFWSLIGIFNGEGEADQTFGHMREISSAILIAWGSIFSIRRGLIRSERLITVIIYAMFAVSLFKIVLITGSLFFDLDPVRFVE